MFFLIEKHFKLKITVFYIVIGVSLPHLFAPKKKTTIYNPRQHTNN